MQYSDKEIIQLKNIYRKQDVMRRRAMHWSDRLKLKRKLNLLRDNFEVFFIKR